MATPVFKFHHPNLIGEDLYFIHNTFFELSETIPMDLASFIWYHYEINRTLEGLSFDTHFEASEKEQLYQDVLFNNTLAMAKHNSGFSNQFIEMLNQNATEIELFNYINNAHYLWVLDVSSYYSRHLLMCFLWDNNQEKFDNFNTYKKDKDVLKELIQISSLGLVFADDCLKQDIELLAFAVRADYRAWFFIPQELHEEVKNKVNLLNCSKI